MICRFCGERHGDCQCAALTGRDALLIAMTTGASFALLLTLGWWVMHHG